MSKSPPEEFYRDAQRRFVTRVYMLALSCCVVFIATLIGVLFWLATLNVAVRDAVPSVVSVILALSSITIVPGICVVWLGARHSRLDLTVAEGLDNAELVAPRSRHDEATSAWHAVLKDPLTGLFSRNALIEFSDDAVSCFRRYNQAVSVLMVEIDTAPLADHPSKDDDSIRHIAEILDLSVRKTDKVARFDAQRFIVLLREIGEEDLMAFANRICVSVSDLALKQGETVVPLTVSIGATIVCEDDAGSQTLLNRAERALSLAKTRGGNRVVMAGAKDVVPLDIAA